MASLVKLMLSDSECEDTHLQSIAHNLLVAMIQELQSRLSEQMARKMIEFAVKLNGIKSCSEAPPIL